MRPSGYCRNKTAGRFAEIGYLETRARLDQLAVDDGGDITAAGRFHQQHVCYG